MQSLQKITSKFIPLRIENVDTDQIIPARFLKATLRMVLVKIYLETGDTKMMMRPSQKQILF
jgi:3-isopropylmalate dehydratase small subunit